MHSVVVGPLKRSELIEKHAIKICQLHGYPLKEIAFLVVLPATPKFCHDSTCNINYARTCADYGVLLTFCSMVNAVDYAQIYAHLIGTSLVHAWFIHIVYNYSWLILGTGVIIVPKLLRSPSNLQKPQQYTAPHGACGACFAYTKIKKQSEHSHRQLSIEPKWCIIAFHCDPSGAPWWGR